MPTVTSPAQRAYERSLGNTSKKDRLTTAGLVRGKRRQHYNIHSLYYYDAGEPRKVTNMRTGQVSYGGRAVAASIAGAARNSRRRRNRGVKGIRLL